MTRLNFDYDNSTEKTVWMNAIIVRVLAICEWAFLVLQVFWVVLITVLPWMITKQNKMEFKESLMNSLAEYHLDHLFHVNEDAAEYIHRDDLCEHVWYERIPHVG